MFTEHTGAGIKIRLGSDILRLPPSSCFHSHEATCVDALYTTPLPAATPGSPCRSLAAF